MKTCLQRLSLLLLLITIHLFAFARYYADSSKHVNNIDSIINAVDAKFKNKAQGDSAINVIVAMSREDSVLRKAYSQYQLFGLTHRQKTLQWNLTSSIIIFWIVIFLVFSGILFAGLQFYRAMYTREVKGANTDLNTELEANLKGIKVSSPVLGVIILTISLLFFYLYLVYVYPINEIF